MQRPLLLLLLAACCVLPLSSHRARSQEGGAKHSQSLVTRPETLAAVRPGMTRDAVVAGLSERYNLNKASSAKEESKGIETWFVMEKTGRGGGGISFSNGSVRNVFEMLSQSDSAEAVNFVQDLFAYIKPEMKPNGADNGVSSKRSATVVIELEETHFRKGGDSMDTSFLKVRFKDVSYDVIYQDDSKDSLIVGRTGPTVKISRSRGTE